MFCTARTFRFPSAATMPLRGQQNTYRRLYSQQPQQPAQSQGSLQLRSRRARSQQQQQNLITMEEAKMWKDMTRGEKVVYATKQTSYAGIVMAGLAITGGLFYMVGSELFSSNNASGVYNRALEMVKSNQELQDILGSPISGFQEHRRGSWKKLVTQAHPETGKKIGYMRFGISGPIAEGTVNVYLTANEKGAWDYTLVNVTTSYQRIIVHDERVKRTRSHRNQTSEAQLMEEAIQ